MSASAALMTAAEGGIIGDGRTGADLALAVGAFGLAIGWLALARVGYGISAGNARIGGVVAIAVGTVGTVLAVLHLATASGGPGTGNGLVRAIVAAPLGLGCRTPRSPGFDPLVPACGEVAVEHLTKQRHGGRPRAHRSVADLLGPGHGVMCGSSDARRYHILV